MVCEVIPDFGITCYKLNFRVSAEFEIAIGIGIEIGSGKVSLAPFFDSDFDPVPILDRNFYESRKLSY